MIELRTRTELDAMREAGRVVAAALAAVRDHARSGMTLRELDGVARTVIGEAGAHPLFLDYHPRWAPRPFPGAICASVNDAIVHGPPGPTVVRDGDLVSIDCGARVDGWCADAAVTFAVGSARPEDARLVHTAQQALDDGIAAACPDGRIGDISRAIGVVGRSGGYGIPGSLGGHGVGRAMRERPFVPNDGRAGRGTPLRPGMVLVLEPMFVAGGGDGSTGGDDGWTVYTSDGSRAAHVGHTVAIIEDGPRVLTA